MEPLWGRETLARQGANTDERNADERASPKGSEQQKHPRVGTRALLQQRDVLGGPRLLRRRGHLLRAQGQGERHSALHLRADRRSEDRRGRRGRRLNRVAGGSDFRAFRLDELRRIPKRRSSLVPRSKGENFSGNSSVTSRNPLIHIGATTATNSERYGAGGLHQGLLSRV